MSFFNLSIISSSFQIPICQPKYTRFSANSISLITKSGGFSVRSAGTSHLQRFQRKIKSIHNACALSLDAPAALQRKGRFCNKVTFSADRLRIQAVYAML